MGKALEKLLGKTLEVDLEQRKKQQRKVRKQKRKVARAAEPKIKKTKKLHTNPEADRLKAEILSKLHKRETWRKKTRVEREYKVPGLVPGLAPIGDDSDESDEDPY